MISEEILEWVSYNISDPICKNIFQKNLQKKCLQIYSGKNCLNKYFREKKKHFGSKFKEQNKQNWST